MSCIRIITNARNAKCAMVACNLHASERTRLRRRRGPSPSLQVRKMVALVSYYLTFDMFRRN